MKNIKLIITAIFAGLSGATSYAQCHQTSTENNSKTVSSGIHHHTSTVDGKLKTEVYKVSGDCEMCETTIEKAAKLDGVKKAEWNKETKILSVVYNSTETSGDAILKSVADSGYDNEKFKANDKVYNSLSGCCQYDREKSNK